MATIRGGYGLPARPSDGYRGPIKSRIPSTRGGVPRSISSVDKQEQDSPVLSRDGVSSSNNALRAKVAQSSKTHHHAIPAFTTRPRASSSNVPVSTADSYNNSKPYRPRVHAQHGSGSSSSSRSNESSLRSGQSNSTGRRISISDGTYTSQLKMPGSHIPPPITSRTHATKSSLAGSQHDFVASSSSSSSYTPTTQPQLSKASGSRQNTSGTATVIYPELDRYRNHQVVSSSDRQQHTDYGLAKLSTHDLPPPTPVSILFSGSSSQLSASPSTKFSESPGPGPYSRDTTPTSMSSQSPGLVAPSRFGFSVKNRQMSPNLTRPPVTRRRTGSITNDPDSLLSDPRGLAAVRESTTSSSSNSTVREASKNGGTRLQKSTNKLAPMPPSPPPRKSSQKFRKVTEERTSPVKAPQPPPQDTQPVPTTTTDSSPTRSIPPSRPSREGTPNLSSQLFDPVPIIKTNISSKVFSGERRGSEPTVVVRPPVSSSVHLSAANKSASTSHLPGLSASNTTTAIKSTTVNQSATTASKSSSVDEEPLKRQRQPSPSPTISFNSRFNFFSRKKSTADSGSSTKDKTEAKKLARKGPVAGTGHEGYGRVGSTRRRSGGPSLGRSHDETLLSQESVSSYDSFLTDRMNPVVISGGAIAENRKLSSESSGVDGREGLTPSSRPSTESRTSSDSQPMSQIEDGDILWPSAMPRGRQNKLGQVQPSDRTASNDPTMRSTLALRRSLHRLKSSPDSPLHLPQPIQIGNGAAASPPMHSLDTSIMSDESLVELQKEISTTSAISLPAPNRLKKRARSPRKWNLFGRLQRDDENQKKNNTVSAKVTPVEKRPVPFYALMDSPERDEADTMDVQVALRHAEVYSIPSAGAAAHNDDILPPPMVPVPQSISDPVAETRIQLSHPVTILSSGRPSRLAQVGRIPQVVSNRVARPSPKSFSRPFRSSLQLSIQTSDFYDPQSIAKGKISPKSSTPVPDLSMECSTVESGTIASSSIRASASRMVPELHRNDGEFIAFSPRKSSEGTIGTSSSSSAYAPFGPSTAVVPKPTDPPVEDEIWDEYDDLLGDDLMKPPLSATSSKGIPFHLETYHDKLNKPPQHLESPTIALSSKRPSRHSLADTRSSFCSADMSERIRTAFQLRPTSVPVVTKTETVRQSSSNGTTSMPNQNRQSTASSTYTRFSDCSSASSNYESPLAQVNLRVGSMTVSKWLTFGHVLFSDLRHEFATKKNDGHDDAAAAAQRLSILVVDGLGNDDWSFYAAETYSSANFFNLSPRAPIVPVDSNKPASSFPLSPPNHHQVQYISHLDEFPFAAQSFDSVVYRFPTAAPESHYKNIMSEARRVLKPGGHIELAILDVDLNNMGNCGRRTIRQLKEKLHDAEPKTHIASAADLIVRLLNNNGFTGVKAARVGVPVASSIARSGSNSSHRKSSSDKAAKKAAKEPPPSLSDMMRDTSPTADASITKMVARVGRWWYTRCYEKLGGTSSPKSIWDDKALLQECEQLGTSLKLTVCYARAPNRIASC